MNRRQMLSRLGWLAAAAALTACADEPAPPTVEDMDEVGAKQVVARVARLMLDGAPRRLTKGATHFHTTTVNPRWAQIFPRTAVIGSHIFYRRPARVASN